MTFLGYEVDLFISCLKVVKKRLKILYPAIAVENVNYFVRNMSLYLNFERNVCVTLHGFAHIHSSINLLLHKNIVKTCLLNLLEIRLMD